MGPRLDGYGAKCPECRKPSGRHSKDCTRNTRAIAVRIHPAAGTVTCPGCHATTARDACWNCGGRYVSPAAGKLARMGENVTSTVRG